MRRRLQTSIPEHRICGQRDCASWKGVDETPNCKFDQSTTISVDQPGYKQCLQTAIKSALGKLFLRSELTGIDTLVLPALGTGTGGLSKGDSYKTLTEALSTCLQAVRCAENLPETIVLTIWRRDDVWPETRNAIARNVLLYQISAIVTR